MKIKLRTGKWLRKALLVWCFVWTVTPLAQAFYNPNSGRWLNRDPIEEKGGTGIFVLVENAPTGRTDKLGLIGLVDPLPPKRCPCTCLSVSVKGKPVDPPGVGLYIKGDGAYFGNDMTITWSVEGNPKHCRYGQNEKGTSTAFPPVNDPRPPKSKTYTDHPDLGGEGLSISYGEHSASYEDAMGIGLLVHPTDNGTWFYVLDISIEFTCKSSDGTTITGKTLQYNVSGQFSF